MTDEHTWRSDIERFHRELVQAREVQKQAQRLNLETTRRFDNLRAYVQLIASFARENDRAIPSDVAEVANQFGMANIVVGIPVEKSAEPASHETLAPGSISTDETNQPEDKFASTWIVSQVLGSGPEGISVPDILRLAKAASVQMHHNYPYIVLRNAVEKGKIIKRGSRYLKKV